ncbi:hypothetical protein J7T55_015491 [Diaporthe amygdali]|uniref:uncharacterized protein n=1 Tax=Phomopsis amygdali TaxID=1214568 RepID=UPI0022FDB9A9|nr:uncharacterized protein J7T55_015491 [Diaporthe amygdali]KAJ0120758.1 hypothetical protein J7T55_015491 [Diaporthe amygdali]
MPSHEVGPFQERKVFGIFDRILDETESLPTHYQYRPVPIEAFKQYFHQVERTADSSTKSIDNISVFELRVERLQMSNQIAKTARN